MMRYLVVISVIFFGNTGWAQDSAKETASGFEDAAQIPDDEKLDRAASYLSEMKDMLRHILMKLKEAREEKDVIKVNCINEILTKVKGLLRISEQAEIALQEAIAKGEKQNSLHEFDKIKISHRKIRILRSDAEQCVGELAFAVGKTEVTVDVDKDYVPEEDPTLQPLPDTPIVRLPAASPYL
jgi:hypothetical protein